MARHVEEAEGRKRSKRDRNLDKRLERRTEKAVQSMIKKLPKQQRNNSERKSGPAIVIQVSFPTLDRPYPATSVIISASADPAAQAIILREFQLKLII